MQPVVGVCARRGAWDQQGKGGVKGKSAVSTQNSPVPSGIHLTASNLVSYHMKAVVHLL